ncbi:MAG: hypothetical protein ACPGES_03575 [Coraliomargarita sp.]
MPDLQQIEAIVIDTVRTLADDFELPALSSPDSSTVLFGGEGPLDSMALVNLIADLEEAVADQFGASIALADEKAMSARNSPYRDVASLTHAVAERLDS